MQRPRQIIARVSIAAILGLTPVVPTRAQSPPLQGKVEQTGIVPDVPPPPVPLEPMPMPVLKPKVQKGKVDDSGAPLQGNVRHDGLGGWAEDEGGGLQGNQAKLDPGGGPLQASATKVGSSDPDEADEELMVEWDRWRNRFLHAVQSGMGERINNPDDLESNWDERRQVMVQGPKYKLGTSAWFSCQILPNRKIINIKIAHSSGDPAYDRSLVAAINDLQGSSILRYPTKSRRTIVSQTAGIKTAETSQYQYFKFGDVERRRVGP